MIVEFFGPPCVGKTTLARHLASCLNEKGHVAELALSYRPAELPAPYGNGGQIALHMPSTLRRLARPVRDMLTLARQSAVMSNELSEAIHLVKLLRPRNLIWTIRLSQYLSRILNSWRHAAMADEIMLFDQAFVQAICSLVLLGKIEDDALILEALDMTPKPDLLIWVDGPRDMLAERLRRRAEAQSATERLLEFDIATNLAFVEIAERLDTLLRRRGRAATRVISLEQGSLDEATSLIEAKVAAMSGTQLSAAFMH